MTKEYKWKKYHFYRIKKNKNNRKASLQKAPPEEPHKF